MERFEIVSMNVGRPRPKTFQNKTVQTAIYKPPVNEPVFLSKLNLDGDEQGDLEAHGGVDKALCVYPHDHYAYWEKELGMRLESATFGENLTIRGLTEDQVHIGDIFRFGEAIVQVTQPRQPCFKLAGKLKRPDMIMKIQRTSYSGYYLRVLQEGTVSKSDILERTEIHPAKVSVAFVNHIIYHDQWSVQALQKILDVDALAANLRASFEKRLKKAQSRAK